MFTIYGFARPLEYRLQKGRIFIVFTDVLKLLGAFLAYIFWMLNKRTCKNGKNSCTPWFFTALLKTQNWKYWDLQLKLIRNAWFTQDRPFSTCHSPHHSQVKTTNIRWRIDKTLKMSLKWTIIFLLERKQVASGTMANYRVHAQTKRSNH